MNHINLPIFDNVIGFPLDYEQRLCAIDDSNYLLIVAGAGSGKTLTMIGKIIYLTKIKNINPKEILCISFTNETTKSFKKKLNEAHINDIDVLTFHKLALNIIKSNDKNIILALPDSLEYIINEFLEHIILNNNYYMRTILKYFNINILYSIKKKYLLLIKTSKFLSLKKLIAKFIHLAKSHNFSIKDILNLYKKQKYLIWNKNRYFLKIVIIIYLWYQHELESNNMYDFDDLLIKAAFIISEKQIKLKYKYILIDEFQDTSPIRLNLVKSIIKYSHAKLTVVGDDWQSIYRFTGCNLELFLNFSKYFEGANIKKIQNTYRNSQQLINIAGDFVMQNNSQLKKNLKSKIQLNKPINIIYYQTSIKESFTKLLNQLYKNKKYPLLILGRNNNDIFQFLSKRFTIDSENNIKDSKHDDFSIKYLTVHKSKGLECDYVVIINLNNSMTGFPNQIKNEKIISYIIDDKKLFPFEEERRLFYVALTRTKNEVFLFTPKTNSSIFVKELVKNYKKLININNV